MAGSHANAQLRHGEVRFLQIAHHPLAKESLGYDEVSKVEVLGSSEAIKNENMCISNNDGSLMDWRVPETPSKDRDIPLCY